MRSIKIGAIVVAAMTLFSPPASAVEFHECNKFINVDKHKFQECAGYSFAEAAQKSNYSKITQWLSANRNEGKPFYSQLLTKLMCGPGMQEGSVPFKAADRQNIIRVTDDLLRLGASFDAMPHFSIVTPLFCASNRKDSVVLNHILNRIQPKKADLDASLYEGVDPTRVPLFRAIMNNDLESAKVLLRHGASIDFSVLENETALKKALEMRNVVIANWLLDNGASVHKRDDKNGCEGKSALDYALEIPAGINGRNEIVARIEQLMTQPSTLATRCNH
ncbi:ankyrin repeat domain-containing protein [Leucothrix pacifica]|uniref:Uncharacterized protein n=1 Tax=Leucothrix pacifica TaxID=1247513 RepID=A0A317CBA8_9GAMM|nr:ankyrin repeat domain-containing protein [Leucothrix pacifica]PWQ95639.1 hypothetical protein DKW60_14580 [Leucothrix pacifica]